MNRTLTTLAALATLSVAALSLSPKRAVAQPALLGPGGIVEMHEELFAALDRFDLAAAQEVLDVDRKGRPVVLMLDDGGDTPITSRTRDGAKKALQDWSTSTGLGTRIVSQQAECPSEGMSFAVLEFERIQQFTDGTRRLRRFRSTSLVRMTKGKWKLFHLHVSPAEDDNQLLKG